MLIFILAGALLHMRMLEKLEFQQEVQSTEFISLPVIYVVKFEIRKQKKKKT